MAAESEHIYVKAGDEVVCIYIQDFLALEDIQRAFSLATGLTYEDATGDKVLMTIRGGRFQPPHDGWQHEGRVYTATKLMPSDVVAEGGDANTVTPSQNVGNLLQHMQKSFGSAKRAKKEGTPRSASSDSEKPIRINVRVIDTNDKPVDGKASVQTFTGAETYQQAVSKAKANFPELAVIGVRLGRLRDENTKCFNGENMRQYLSQKLLKPSASTFYLQIKAKEREEKAKLGKRTTPILPPNTADNLDDDDDSSSDDDDRAHSDAAFEQLSTMVTNIKPTNLKKLEKIGEGGEAVVYKGDWCGTIVALKETVLSSASFANAIKRQLVKEVHMHAELRHPNIVTFFGISNTERSIMIVTELMDMSLDIVMFPTTEAPAPITLNEIEKLNISAEVTKGLMYLHGKSIVHADVKPPNILISKDLKNVKLCDIGLSRVKLSIRMSSTQSPKKGTVLYMSPAMLLDNARSSFSCDVWALGATMAELFSGLDMWRIPGDLNRLEKKLKSNMRSQTDPHALAALRGDTDGEEIYEVVKSCLEYNIPKRATPAKILEKLITIIEIKQVAVAQPEVEAQEGVVDKKESEVRGQAQEVQAAAQVREEERPTKQTVKDHVPSKHATRSKSAKRK